MSVTTEITRLQEARNTIRDKMIELGLAQTTDKLDKMATEISKITNVGAVNANVTEGSSYTIPKGYHNGAGVITGVAGGGNYSLQEKSVTPTKSQQAISSDEGYYGLSSVTVAAIPEAYQNVTGVTAAAGDVLATKVIVNAEGDTVVGTMANNGAVTKSLDAATTSYAIPKGYHNGSGAVSITTEEKSTTPTTTAQDITPTTGKVLSKVTVAAIPDNFADASEATAEAAHLLAGKVAYGYNSSTGKAVELEGTMVDNGAVSKTLDAATTSYIVPQGYHNGSGAVSITTEEKSTTTTTSAQTISPTAGKVLSKVTVAAIPGKFGDTSDATGEASHVLAGKIVYGYNSSTGKATKLEGTMANNGSVTATMDGMTTTSITIPVGYTTGGTISLTEDIETALAAI